ncbi:MAG: serine--tRNA ligase [Nitrospirae bacterium]|nr:serine--tRNA ligase [Nitrospirota bacterium]
MLDIRILREQRDRVEGAYRARGYQTDLESLLQRDGERRRLQREIDALKQQRNQASEAIAKLKRSGTSDDEVERLRTETQRVGDTLKALETQWQTVDAEVEAALLTLPNLPHDSVPVGRDASSNVEVRRVGEPRRFGFAPQPHWELGERLGILDFERGARITGSRFTVSRGVGARLERALMNFMLDRHTTDHGYTEVLPPFLVNRASMTGTGQLPKFEDDLFRLEADDYFLIPTGEVPLTNLHRDEILAESDLPIAYAASTPCFRREAGSYGRDVRGLIRQHQFNKVELVTLTTSEASYDALERLVRHAEAILTALELPYRVMALCTGDLGFGAAKTYDLEVWLPGEDAYREISSCSNFEAFQARRIGIRYRPAGGKKTEFVHTLNGSGLAVGRTVVAILENYQEADGTVVIPKALRPYLGGVDVIRGAS